MWPLTTILISGDEFLAIVAIGPLEARSRSDPLVLWHALPAAFVDQQDDRRGRLVA